jgi:hypothetical protein
LEIFFVKLVFCEKNFLSDVRDNRFKVSLLNQLVFIFGPPDRVSDHYLSRVRVLTFSYFIAPFVIKHDTVELESAKELRILDGEFINVAILNIEIPEAITPSSLVRHG